MHRWLLAIGGAFNCLLALFHGWLGWQIYRFAGATPGVHTLMEMLNTAVTLMIIFFAVSSLGYAGDMLGSKLGKLVLGFVFLLYFSRALMEIFISPRFSILIFALCILIALIYLVLLVMPVKPRSGATSEHLPA